MLANGGGSGRYITSSPIGKVTYQQAGRVRTQELDAPPRTHLIRALYSACDAFSIVSLLDHRFKE